jgi:hypothetical protein
VIATTTGAKVYYLPRAEPVLDTPTVSRRVGLRRRLLLTWWRLRLSLADVRIGSWRLRRRRHHDDYATLLDEVLGESPAQLIERRRPKPSRPAAILDFEAARLRLRAQTS